MLKHSDIRLTLAIYTRATESMQDSATAALQRIAMTLTRIHANVMPCTVGTPFYGS